MISEALENLIYKNSTEYTLVYKEDTIYWIFNAGLGCVDYHTANSEDTGYVMACLDFNILRITDEVINVQGHDVGWKVIKK